ncbi:MAG: hypothetical protein OQJ81_04700, partial [Melioribacteraceae bacterium]|nr:hypothetical protein [Melioribacteraceae bacterium]
FGNYEKINALLFVMVLILLASILIDRNKAKIERRNCTLPLSISSIGFSRTVFLLFPWIIIIPGLYISNYILLPSSLSYVNILIGQFSAALILFFLIVFIQDVYQFNVSSQRITKYTRSLLFTLFIFCLTVLVFIFADFVDPKIQSGFGILFPYTWGIILSFLAVISFIQRKSYL